VVAVEVRDLLGRCVPNDHSRQVVPEYFADYVLSHNPNVHTVVDLGSGTGGSVDYFRKKNPRIQWIGVDITWSPEVSSRTRKDAQFITYDGTRVPLRDNSVDLIYCVQALQCAAHPREVLKEVHRTLKPGGYFVGATAQLEPLTVFSYWNYTVYGFFKIVSDAGLELVEIRPSIDSLTLIVRRGLRRPAFFKVFWTHESPLNFLIGVLGRLLRKNHAWINSFKLLFCGQFCFLVRKP